MLVVHRVVDWAPCLPGKQKGSSHSESWSEVSDRIDGWWKQKPPQDSRTRALVSSAEKILGRKIRRALPLAPRLVSLDRANAIIEGARYIVPGKRTWRDLCCPSCANGRDANGARGNRARLHTRYLHTGHPPRRTVSYKTIH